MTTSPEKNSTSNQDWPHYLTALSNIDPPMDQAPGYSPDSWDEALSELTALACQITATTTAAVTWCQGNSHRLYVRHGEQKGQALADQPGTIAWWEAGEAATNSSWVIEDMGADARWAEHPWVQETPQCCAMLNASVQTYTGSQSHEPQSHEIVAHLAVFATTPRTFSPAEVQGLENLASQLERIQWLRPSETLHIDETAEPPTQTELQVAAGHLANIGGWLVLLADPAQADDATDTIIWSDEVCAIHEVPPGFAPTLDQAIDFYVPSARDAVRQAFTQCATKGIAYEQELEIVTAKGRRRWVRSIGQAVRDETGRIAVVQGAFEDITTRKREGMALQRLARQLTDTLETMTDAFLAIDSDERISYVNQEAEQILHKTREEIVGHTLIEVVPELVHPPFDKHYHQFVKNIHNGDKTYAFTEYYAPKQQWYEVRSYRSAEGLAVYFNDVTDERTAQAALRESEQRLREMAESLEDVFWIRDVHDDKILYVSPSYETLFGLTTEELYENSRAYQRTLPPEDLARLEDKLEEDLYNVNIDYRVVQPHGEVRWVNVRTSPIYNDEGQVVRTVGTARDITPIVDAAERLRTSERQYRLLFEDNPHPMFVVEPDTLRVLAYNHAAQTHYGYNSTEFLQLVLDDVRPGSQEQTHLKQLAQESTDLHYMAEWQQHKKDGSRIDVEIHATHTYFDNQPALLVLAIDITERLRNETRIREQAEMLNQSSDAINARDLNHQITYWNKSAEALYGWSAEEAIGRDVRELVTYDLEAFAAASKAVLAHGEWSGELFKTTRAGKSLIVASSWTLVRHEDGEPYAILTTQTDVTERKKLEEQFLRAQRMEGIGRLASGIAHDLNNVLSPILLSLGMLRLSMKEPREQKLLNTLEQSAQRGADLLHQVLSFARGVEGERKAVNLAKLLDELHTIIHETFTRKIRIVIHADDNLWPVLGDRTQIQQILLNLCVNARDAMPSGGTISINAYNVYLDEQFLSIYPNAPHGDYACISVTDTGTGIPYELLGSIFEPFFTTKEEGKGTGLGLSTVQAVAKSHGGFVTVYSERGHGTEFHVYLPAHKEGNGSNGSTVDEAVPRGNGELILLVEDEDAVRTVTEQTLQRFGYEVLVAKDGAEALALYTKNASNIELVLTDMMMPVMDGYATIQALQRIDPAVKIVAASGLAEGGMLTKATSAGVNHFLQKPFTARTLLTKLKEVLHS